MIRAEAESFVANFDFHDAEDVQVRTDALISAMVKAGVLKDHPKGYRLHIALERVKLPLANRQALANRAEMFHDLISSYGGEPGEEDMIFAKGLLQQLVTALGLAIDERIKKGT